MNIPAVIASELNVKVSQVNEVITLFGEGATIPFIARYRKERTDGLDEEQLRVIEERQNYLTLLQDRKATVLKSIEEQGKLTDELKAKIESAVKLQEVEDLYLPYKPKRKTRGTIAVAKGLEPLALFILNNPNFNGNFEEKLAEFINEDKGVKSIDEALQGAKDIIAEMISDNAEVRKALRELMIDTGKISSQKAKVKEEDIQPNKKDVYDIYHEFIVQAATIKPYQTLAINRGEKEKFLKVSMVVDNNQALSVTYKRAFNFKKTIFEDILRETVEDSFQRLIFPSIEREVRNHLTEIADLHAIEVFASNL
ncbi:MAG: Tex-like N-terminal domain-containing protein, partial [Bacteroidota bacterium]